MKSLPTLGRVYGRVNSNGWLSTVKTKLTFHFVFAKVTHFLTLKPAGHFGLKPVIFLVALPFVQVIVLLSCVIRISNIRDSAGRVFSSPS